MTNILILYNNASDRPEREVFEEVFKRYHKKTIANQDETISISFGHSTSDVEYFKNQHNNQNPYTHVFAHSLTDEEAQKFFPNARFAWYTKYDSKIGNWYEDAFKKIQATPNENKDEFIEVVIEQFMRLFDIRNQNLSGYYLTIFGRQLEKYQEDFFKFLKKQHPSLKQFDPATIDYLDIIVEVIEFFKQYDTSKLKESVSSLNPNTTESSEIIGDSEPLKKVNDLIARAAEGKFSLLIRGESGTGKELVAKAVHFSSSRRTKPLVCLNCAAIAESLLASELFGHEKGAFTGATDRKIGKFEAAHTGTLFLDEIGEMPVALQSKLLRVLEGHPFERVGGNTPISTDVRVIAATNRDLEKEVAEGRFRHDLFFRLRVLEIIVPPLRKRTDDIPVLAEYFLDKYSKETGRKYQGFAEEAMNALLVHRWPGNVRELKNVVERSVVLGTPPWIYEQDLLLSSLSTTGETDIRKTSTKTNLFEPVTLDQMEKAHIQKMLEYTQGNKSLAARTLGIERTTLDRKIKRYQLDE